LIEKLNVPAAVGVPLIVFCVLITLPSINPGGSAPDETLQLQQVGDDGTSVAFEGIN
jgi:hypothetical protein